MIKNKNSLVYIVATLLCALVITIPIVYAQQLRIDSTDVGVGDASGNGLSNTNTNNGKNTNDNSPVTKGAYLFPGLTSAIASLLAGAGITYLLIGVAVIVGGYVVYRIGYSAWMYYHAYSYTQLSSHGYDHINDFPNIWKKPQSKKDFENKCKDNMNSKSVERYVQSDGRSIAYNPSTQMVTVGEVDGKTVVTCYKDKDISSKTRGNNPIWKRVK
jgi:hypothetical protein